VTEIKDKLASVVCRAEVRQKWAQTWLNTSPPPPHPHPFAIVFASCLENIYIILNCFAVNYTEISILPLEITSKVLIFILSRYSHATYIQFKFAVGRDI